MPSNELVIGASCSGYGYDLRLCLRQEVTNGILENESLR